MKVHAIDVEKLKREGDLSSLWYQFENGDLYILLGAQSVEYFEFTREQGHLEGGAKRGLKYGKIVETQEEEGARAYKRSRLVEYQQELDEELLKWSQRFMYECPNVENSLKEGIMEYLEHRGERPGLLTLSEGEYESYRHPKAPTRPPFKVNEHKRSIQIIVVVTLLLWPIIYFFQQKRVASDMQLKNQCAAGDQASCQKVKQAQLVTMNKDIARPLNVNLGSSEKLIQRCLDENYCDYNLIRNRLVAVKDIADSEMGKLRDQYIQQFCLDKKQSWACLKYLETLFLASGERKEPEFSEVSSRLKSDCQQRLLPAAFCRKMDESLAFFEQKRKCLQLPHSDSCQQYYRKVISKGLLGENLEAVGQLCANNRPYFCLELAKFYAKDQNHPNHKSRVKRALGLWKKACFELNEPNSCYYFSVRNGVPVTFKDQKKRKKLLNKCLAGSEAHCRQLRRVAEEYL